MEGWVGWFLLWGFRECVVGGWLDFWVRRRL